MVMGDAKGDGRRSSPATQRYEERKKNEDLGMQKDEMQCGGKIIKWRWD